MRTTDAEEFELVEYLASIPNAKELLAESEGRRALTQADPLLFALVYLTRHLKTKDERAAITFSDFHLDVAAKALEWVRPVVEPRGSRHAYVAPRNTGKSTWLFLILPMWAAAHGHIKFVAAFADSATQAENHLATFRRELQHNELLKADYPELQPQTSRRTGATTDNKSQYTASGGFTFMAKGIDSSSLGLKVGDRRPDLIVLDDVEPDESNYTVYQAEKRLTTLTDAVLPLNELARVCLVGTVTMPESIVHQLVRSVRTTDNVPEWITSQRFVTHYYPPIVVRPDGSERSIWPDMWSITYLNSIRKSRDYRKNFENDPMGLDGEYWTLDDFVITDLPVSAAVLSIDPAVTSKKTSDQTGLAVVGWSPTERKFVVKECIGVRLNPQALRHTIVWMVNRNPQVRRVLIETNQGGDVWRDLLKGLPVPIDTVHQSVKKEIRAVETLNLYQQGHVVHAKEFIELQTQMIAFGRAQHDDLVDAVGSGIAYLLKSLKYRRSRSASQSFSYV